MRLLLLFFFISNIYAQVSPDQSTSSHRLKGWRKIYKKFKAYEYKRSTQEIEEPFSIIQDSEKKTIYHNEMRVLNNGLAALYARLEMIKRAQKSIEMEYFIFTPEDLSSKLILNELIKKANDGVKIRILVDKSVAVFKLTEHYVSYIKKQLINPSNFDVRFYNDADTVKETITQAVTANLRNHRKLFIIDNKELIAGGRNIEDKYFDLDKEYNFDDRDVWVKGTIVPKIKESFERYWSNKISQRYEEPEFNLDEFNTAKKTLTLNYEDVRNYQKIMNFGKTNMERLPIRECPKTSFATDLPGATSWDRIKVSSYKEKFRVTERAFGERLRKSEKALISSPYFMLNTRSGKLMDDLVDAGVELKFLTNSLGSTDAFYVAAAFYRVVNDWRDIGIDTYVHTSKYHENGNLVVFPEVKKAKWGMHQKSHVYFYRDGTSGIMVGTYNVDNRSSFYNNELAVFCDGSDALTQDVYQDALDRVENNSSLVVGKELAKFQNQEPSKEDYYGNASQKEIKRIKLIKAPIEALQFLL